MSPTLDAIVTGFVTGDDVSLRRTIDRDGGGVSDEALASGVTIARAWLTVKAAESDADADALVQKEVTTTNVAGTGQIENDGTGDVDPVIRFDLVPADTEAIGLTARYFDVQVLTNGAKLYTPEVGRIRASKKGITLDTS